MNKEFPSHPFFDKERKPQEERPVIRPGEAPFTPEPEKESPQKKTQFHAGERVKIEDTKGKIVDGWKIGEVNEQEGYAVLIPEGAEGVLDAPMTQKISLEKLGETNTEKPSFADASNFEELYAEINKTGGLEGSKKFYPAEELRELIEEARKNPLQTARITNTDGLRDRVIALIQEELAYKHQEITHTKESEEE
jgi:hypothetical protein